MSPWPDETEPEADRGHGGAEGSAGVGVDHEWAGLGRGVCAECVVCACGSTEARREVGELLFVPGFLHGGHGGTEEVEDTSDDT